MSKLRVVVLMGGKSPEHEVSLSSGKKILSSLDSRKYDVIPLIITKKGEGYSQLFSSKPDIVFIAIHGPFGEDGTVQGLLESIGIPYIGSGVLASALGMDKPMFKKIMRQEKIRIPDYLVLSKNEKKDRVWKKFKPPVIVKPSSQGSSVGVGIVRAREKLKVVLQTAFEYGPKALVEEYLPGVEVSCGVLGNSKPLALPLVEIVPKKVQEIALKVYQAIGCRGFGRVDVIISEGRPYILEINTIPGLTPNSLLPKEAAAAGISYSQLLDRLLELALERD